MTQSEIRPRRSLLFVPGLRPDRFSKALDSGADIVCIDIEDAVPLPRKEEARGLTFPLFATDGPANVETMVRVNPISTPDGLRDILALLEAEKPPKALMLAKPGSAAEIRLYDELLQGSCSDIRFHVIIESTEGLANVMEIADASSRIESLLFGAVDMSADLRAAKTWETMLYARSRVVHAAARFDLDLLDVPYLNLDDQNGLEEEAKMSAALGFTGKASIHPKQIPIINSVFSPTPALVDRARRILEEFESDETGLVVVDGELIERPVIRSMQRVVVIADYLDGKH
ncbi:MAG: CoA ester lyase [Pelagibacteraceae bacterium]|nr:CoA ester lyase [Pelagibacteraceae bacterium]PPR10070.1 MAG: Citrate lyase subunit beta [Alphaproteobacteria bacterium MarineAlpha11_Bin1]|tara:strand:+ start:3548 stop:4408 length:861 start_codon:yes stop_codon:yes gene_type:complete